MRLISVFTMRFLSSSSAKFLVAASSSETFFMADPKTANNLLQKKSGIKVYVNGKKQ